MARPAAYLRKSRDASTKQEHLNRLLRSIEDHQPGTSPIVYDDWARSGDRAKLASRRQWADLCAAIERGAHDAVHMNDLDRGGRSLEEWLRFIRVAQEHGASVIAGDVDYSLAENKDRLVFEGWLAERELDAAKRRAKETIRMRKRRGDKIGGTPYGKRFAKDAATGRVIVVDDPERPIQPVLDAVRDAGNNIPAAVRLLNERNIPSRFGRKWSQHALRALLVRQKAMPPVSRRARKTRNGTRMPSPLSRLVRCHCSTWMTPVDSRSGLYCAIGVRDGMAKHGKNTVSQRPVWEAIATAAEDLGREETGSIVHSSGPSSADRLPALEEERRRLGKAYRAQTVDDGAFDRESDRLAAEIERAREDLDAEEIAITVRMTRPVVDLRLRETDTVRLGEQLRRAFREVRLGKDLRPVEVLRR